jgi:hypothetical protein
VITRSVLAIAAAAGIATPGAALAQAPTGPIVPPAQGTTTGATWSTIDLGTCSIATGTAVVNGNWAGCAWAGAGAPDVAVSAFGSVWLAGSSIGAPGAAITALQPVDPVTSLPGSIMNVTGITAPAAAVAAGGALWFAGSSASSNNGHHSAVAVAVTPTGAVRHRFRGPVSSYTASGQSIAYGAGAVWLGDDAGRIYALSPTRGSLIRQIRTPNTSGLAVSSATGTLWATGTRGRSVRVFSTATGAQRKVFGVVGSPNAVVSAGGSMWVFTQRYLYRYDPRRLRQTARYAMPPSQSGWLGAVSGPGGLWASNWVAQVVRFNTSTRTFDVDARWSNQNFSGPLASAGGSVWVPDRNNSPFPVGHAVTRITPTGS